MPRSLGLVLLGGAAGCCLPVPEVHRAAASVTVTMPADRVAACTWSSWTGPVDGCTDLAEGVPSGAGWDLGPLRDPVTVIFGEAPLMESVFVACQGEVPVGARWVPFVDHPEVVVVDGLAPPDPALRSRVTAEEAEALLTRVCSRDPALRR